MWQFWIDRGGTFTDCLGRDPATGDVRAVKVLSSDRAPLEGIRRLLGIAEDAVIPPCEVRMGTTLATNALLERRGMPCALVVTRGFGELLAIGDQSRPELFALDIVKPPPLAALVIEVDARLAADGSVLARPDEADLAAALVAARARGAESLAVAVLHSYVDDALERAIGETARAAGFAHVSLSAEVAGEQGFLARAQTAVLDGYLTPLLRRYLERLAAELAGSSVRVMQSSGGLTDAARLRGPDAILSGPAGGVVACGEVARRAGLSRAIGFDMGGTSTDVSCVDGGAPDRVYEMEVAGVVVRAPALDIKTVAAGGGSLCRYSGLRLTVGPDSAGADPGPICYRRGGRDLTITDVDLALGRVVGDRFPFPLERAPVDAALAAVADAIAAAEGRRMSAEEVAAGFSAVADASMAEAIRQVSIARGRDPRDFALVVFGGAGGQHACAVARQLGIRTLLCDRRAGVLSAWGMGLARVSWHGEADAGRRPLDGHLLADLEPAFAALEARGRAALAVDGVSDPEMRRFVALRYAGADTAIAIDAASPDLAAAFETEHRRLFGYARAGHPIEAHAIRGQASGPQPTEINRNLRANGDLVSAARRAARLYCGEWVECPVFWREDLAGGATVPGPALILDETSTTVVDPGWELEVAGDGLLIVRDREPTARAIGDTGADPVRLEIFGNRFMSIAHQMGAVLQRTAISTNIRERLDFSCAVFDRAGGLVANAPHIPVHLGAMGESVRAVRAAHPVPAPGSAFATNDPSAGGSHLPDVTVVTPVHGPGGELLFFTASRGHHADIGGITPGSMPPDSRTLDEEGAVLRTLEIVRDGALDRDLVLAHLTAGPWPARRPRDNLADLEAQLAACWTGARLLGELCAQSGTDVVLAYLGHVQDNAAAQVAAEIARLPDGVHRFADALDDGTPIAVAVRVAGSAMEIDFAGTGAEVDGNLNAPRAVTVAAVLYVLRCLVGAPIPLNAGCLRPVTLHLPAGSILDPSPGRAVAGGNVETSQRVVDVLLAALGLAAASQGTMNNLTFGDDAFGYYETIAGGAGATRRRPGASGVHTHMTNTRITDPEVLESRFPVRLVELSLRRGSGGAGRLPGGDGVVRELELLRPLEVSILSERRRLRPFGLAGGQPGAAGRNLHNGAAVGGRARFHAAPGDRVRIETPGGGGYGSPAAPAQREREDQD
jgi:5-oxoprolinase (ATP-hydrolysing)